MGVNNNGRVSDALSQLNVAAHQQRKDKHPQKKLKENHEPCKQTLHWFSDKCHDVIAEGGKICCLKALQHVHTKWHHSCLMHPGETRLEIPIGQHCCQMGMMHHTMSCMFDAVAIVN